MNKKELREIYTAKRKELSYEKIEELSKRIGSNILKNFNLENKTISLFLPIKSQNEINTFLLLDDFLKLGTIVGISKTNFKTLELTHYKYISKDQLSLNSFGIPEPIFGEEIKPEKFEIVFVPLYTIDKDGQRVGYGKGIYDRFLKVCDKNCLFIGLNLFNKIEVIDNILPTDISLNYCVTPQKVIKFN